MNRHSTILAPAAAYVLVATLATAPRSMAAGLDDINLVSVEQEWQLGDQVENELAGKLRIVDDRQTLRYVDGIVQRLADETTLGRLPWTTHLVADPELNAFNTPGGNIYVNTGLIAATDSAAELAGVIAHEVAHGAERHGTEQLTKAYGFNLLAGMLLGRNPSLGEQIAGQLVGASTFAAFGRTAEREADILGVRLMHQAGYDPRGMAEIFRKLVAKRRTQPGRVQQFFSSHPLTETRIAAVEAEARRLPGKRLVRDEAGFRNARQRAAQLGR